MNRIYRSIWNDKTGTFVAASENARNAGRKPSPGTTSRATGVAGDPHFVLKGLAASLMLLFGSSAHALPTGGEVTAGKAGIANGAGKTTITQSSQNVAINWQSFGIGQGESVRFVQPNSQSVALNRVLGSDPSSILGSLSANGQVFLLNPNGILFGNGAQVNVGGLVASTRNITDGDFMAGRYKFSGTGGGAVLNQGSINANGGYVALLGATVSNEGVISARLGTVALAAGNAVTLDVAGDGLLNVMVSRGAVEALAQNGGLIRADGGQVLLTARSAGNLLQSAVNNTGVIRAQTIENRNGTIRLMGDMQTGTVNVGGTLDASAPRGGDGGFIETSAAHVKVANDVKITTAAPTGRTGTWLIDPLDFVIDGGGDIDGPTLSAQLVNTSIVIATVAGPGPGNGDIFVNDPLTWTAAGGTTTLTLNALRDVNVNQAIVATNGNLVVCCGRDVNVNAPITTVGGSVLLSAANNVNMNAAMSTTNGNITMCAGQDVNISAALTLVDFAAVPSQSLGLADGLVLSAGNNGTGPGVGGGTVTFAPLTPPAAITNAPVTIFYNPVSYAAPTDFSTPVFFTLVGGSSVVTSFMLVHPEVANQAQGTSTAATFTGLLKGNPVGVTLAGAGTGNFGSTAALGTQTVTFSGFSLGGPNAGDFALPGTAICCTPAIQRTTGTITAAAPPVVPPGVPPGVPPVVLLPPVVVPPLLPPVVPPDVVPPIVVTTTGVPPVVVAPPEVVSPVVVAPPEVVPPVAVVPPAPPLARPPRADRN